MCDLALSIGHQRCITHCGPIRYTMLHQTPDLNYFIHPLALRKLALFLVEYVNVRFPIYPCYQHMRSLSS
jgi:hypothetical protein